MTEAVRKVFPEARRARHRAAAQAYCEYLRGRTAQGNKDDVALIDGSNEIALRGSEW